MKKNRRWLGGDWRCAEDKRTLKAANHGPSINVNRISKIRKLKKCLLTSLVSLVFFLTRTVNVSAAELDIRGSRCPHPSVPYASTYQNISGGPDDLSGSWKIKYICDNGYELFGNDIRECRNGNWPKSSLPICSVNVARYKPASSSSVVNLGHAGNAVDGKSSTVHEGKRCTETQKQKSPWWTVDLLESFEVHQVRITTRCCDGVPVKKAEIRVGNSTTPSDNPLCNWIPKALEEGATETLDCEEHGRYVSITMTGVESVLSLCEVEIFSPASPKALSPNAACSDTSLKDISVFQNSCFTFLPDKISGYDEADGACRAATGAHLTGSNYRLLHHINELSTKYITSRVEAERLKDKDLSSRNNPQVLVWVGAKRKDGSSFKDQSWQWITGENGRNERVGKIDWGRGQPSNRKDQNCALLDSHLKWGWNDLSCRVSAVTVCTGQPSHCYNPNVNQGVILSNPPDRKGWKVGDVAEYICPVGEKPIGNTKRTCRENGAFDGNDLGISCKFVDCGKVPGLANGEIHVIDGRMTYGARVRYKCKQDYTLINGNEERVCEEGGWTGSQPECVYTKCSDPPPILHGKVQSIGNRQQPKNTLGSKLLYECDEGFRSIGTLTRECIIGGEWSGDEPKCEFVDCGEPEKVENGSFDLISGRTTHGAQVEYVCNADYLPSGSRSTTKRCGDDGRWHGARGLTCEIIRCPTPRPPTGGHVSGYNTAVHSKIEYSCLPGHVLEGETEASCTRSGLWSSHTPTCRYIECGKVKEIKSGTVLYANGTTHIGSIVRYTCDKSHILEGAGGSGERLCLESGRWSGRSPKCSEVRCKLPPRPNNTVISVSSTERLHGTSVIRSKISMKSSYRVGSTLKYRCDRGYILENVDGTRTERVMTRRCITSGGWTGSEPVCKFVDCGQPIEVENSKFSLQNNRTYFGSIATYECNDHFKLNGPEKVRCGSRDRWEPAPPTCEETLCKPLKQPLNGTMVLTTLRIGGKATFKCDYGFSLKGDDDLECLSSGSWSSWPPTCLEINCGKPHNIDNGRIFLPNGTTRNGDSAEYHCLPGYERDGPFIRTCLLDGYWSGVEPSCQRPRLALKPILTILSDNTVDGTTNVRAGSADHVSANGSGGSSGIGSEEASGAGLYIGIALGLIVVIGLLILGIYFYRKQRAIASKPPPQPYRDRNANGIGIASAMNGYTSSGVYHSASSGVSSGAAVGGPPGLPGQRPPPPIQMYSMADDSSNILMNGSNGGINNHLHTEDHRGPIYDTINDDSSGGGSGVIGPYGGSTSHSSASDHGNQIPPYLQQAQQQSTFSPINNNGYHMNNLQSGLNPALNGKSNEGYNHTYDVPEGSESGMSGRPPLPSPMQQANGAGGNAVGAVTINGIAV